MKIGVLKEIKNKEFRISINPFLTNALSKRGHQVFIEDNAALAIGFSNEDYKKANGIIVKSPKQIFENCELIVKVKEPQYIECKMLKKGQILFTYFHLASSKEMTLNLINSKSTCIAYETIIDKKGSLPLLIPMSQIAGRLTIQIGATLLEKTKGGKGILLSGVPGVKRGKVVIIGAGVVGYNAALIALGMGAEVCILDNNINKLNEIEINFNRQIKTIFSNSQNIEKNLIDADLCIGSILIPGESAPKLVTKDMIKKMSKGSVVIDVAIDQGGCFETSRPTTLDNPTYEVDGVIHYCVSNIPGCVAKTSTTALINSTTPYILKLADNGMDIFKKDSLFREGLNIVDGKITYKPVADSLNLDFYKY